MKKVALLLFAIALAAPLASARTRDPLTAKEADEMREAATEPDKRLPLIVRFIRARLDAVARMRSDPRFAADRAPQIHDLLDEVTALVDELGDNIDDFTQRGQDVRKPLKLVIEGLNDFQVRLRAIKTSKDDPAFAAEYKDYSFVLDSALDAVNAGLDSAHKTLDQQEAYAAQRKKEGTAPPRPHKD